MKTQAFVRRRCQAQCAPVASLLGTVRAGVWEVKNGGGEEVHGGFEGLDTGEGAGQRQSPFFCMETRQRVPLRENNAKSENSRASLEALRESSSLVIAPAWGRWWLRDK